MGFRDIFTAISSGKKLNAAISGDFEHGAALLAQLGTLGILNFAALGTLEPERNCHKIPSFLL